MLGQYFILWWVILQSEFSVSLFKAAGDILLKKGVFLLTVTTCIHVSKAMSVFLTSIFALICAGTIYRLELICHCSKVFCWSHNIFIDLPQILLNYHKWIHLSKMLCSQPFRIWKWNVSLLCRRLQCTYV